MIRAVRTGKATTWPAARAARSSASSTAALAMRTIIGLMPALRAPRDSAARARARASGDATGVTHRSAQVTGAEAAKFALASVERRDRLDQVWPVEIRPQGVGEMELGVRRFPDQEVGNALLARGPDHQLRLRQGGVVEGAGDVLVTQFPKVLSAGGEVPYGIHDLSPSAIVDQQVEHPA